MISFHLFARARSISKAIDQQDILSLSLSPKNRDLEGIITSAFPDERSARKREKNSVRSRHCTLLRVARPRAIDSKGTTLGDLAPSSSLPPRTLDCVRNARAMFVHRCARNRRVFCLCLPPPSPEFRSKIHDPRRLDRRLGSTTNNTRRCFRKDGTFTGRIFSLVPFFARFQQARERRGRSEKIDGIWLSFARTLSIDLFESTHFVVQRTILRE